MVDVQGLNASHKCIGQDNGVSILMTNHGLAMLTLFWRRPSVYLYSVAVGCLKWHITSVGYWGYVLFQATYIAYISSGWKAGTSYAYAISKAEAKTQTKNISLPEWQSSCTTQGKISWEPDKVNVVVKYCPRPSGPYTWIADRPSELFKLIVHNKPGKPKTWSPCRCVINILSSFPGRMALFMSCVCVPSPQSNIQHEPVGRRTTRLEAPRVGLGLAAPVPKKWISMFLSYTNKL
jgi:hypothetical protein